MKKNNKGFSLIELIVVVAISSIVLLMGFTLIVNSTRMYGREDAVINMQTEVQMITSNLTEALMEATKLEFLEKNGNVMLDLGELDVTTVENPPGSGNMVTTYSSKNKSDCRRVFFSKDSTFLALPVNCGFCDNSDNMNYIDTLARYAPKGSAPDQDFIGYMLSGCVERFSIEIDAKCSATTTILDRSDPDPANWTEVTEPVYVNPIIVNIKYAIKGKTYSDDMILSVQLRNNLDEVTINGTTTKVVDKVAK